MTRKLIAPIVLALVLGALPASAASRSHDREHRSHANRQEAKIASLADRLDIATTELFSEAATRSHRHGWRNWRALHTLRSLERSADRFEAVVERRGAKSRHAAAAYEQLECDFQDALARRHQLRRGHTLNQEFARVEQLIGKLDVRLARLGRDDGRRYGSRFDDDDDDDERVEQRRRARRGYGEDGRGHVAFRFGF